MFLILTSLFGISLILFPKDPLIAFFFGPTTLIYIFIIYLVRHSKRNKGKAYPHEKRLVIGLVIFTLISSLYRVLMFFSQ